jgi:hypothetical protein
MIQVYDGPNLWCPPISGNADEYCVRRSYAAERELMMPPRCSRRAIGQRVPSDN